jgi:hypothetical protein
MVHSLISQIALCTLFAVSAFAFLKGGIAERCGAALICLSWLGGDSISFLSRNLLSRQSFELTLLIMDAALAIGFLAIALRFAKLWLGFAMLMQSGELALHGAVMGDWGLPFFEYIMFNNFLSFGLVLLLAGATATAWFQRTHKLRMRAVSSETSADFRASSPTI